MFRLTKSTLVRKSTFFLDFFKSGPDASAGKIGDAAVYDIPERLGLKLADFEVILEVMDDGMYVF